MPLRPSDVVKVLLGFRLHDVGTRVSGSGFRLRAWSLGLVISWGFVATTYLFWAIKAGCRASLGLEVTLSLLTWKVRARDQVEGRGLSNFSWPRPSKPGLPDVAPHPTP